MQPLKPFLQPDYGKALFFFSAADVTLIVVSLLACWFLIFKSEMQRDETDQRLRELEEGENYFIISPDSQRENWVRPYFHKYSIYIFFLVPGRINLLIVTTMKFLLRPYAFISSLQSALERDWCAGDPVSDGTLLQGERRGVGPKSTTTFINISVSFKDEKDSLSSIPPDEQREQRPKEDELPPDAPHPGAGRRRCSSDLWSRDGTGGWLQGRSAAAGESGQNHWSEKDAFHAFQDRSASCRTENVTDKRGGEVLWINAHRL